MFRQLMVLGMVLGPVASLPHGASAWAQAAGQKEDSASSDEVRRLLMSLAPVPLKHARPISSVTFAPDGKTVITVSNTDARVSHWDAFTGKLMRAWNVPQATFYHSALSARGNVLAANAGGVVSVWDGATGKRLHTLKDAAGPSLAVSADGKSVVSGLKDGGLGVFDTASGKLRGKLPKSHWSRNQALAFSPDGKRIAASRADGTVGIWDADSAREVATLPVGTADVRLVAFTPSGKGLASVSGGGAVKLWDVATAKPRRDMQLPVGHVATCGVFAPDGRTFITGGMDSKVRITEIASGRQRHCFPAVPDGVIATALAPDGRSVAIGSAGPVALVRDVNGAAPVDDPRARLAPPQDAAAAWNDLAHADPARGYRAMAALAAQPKEALALFQRELRPTPPLERGKIAQLIKKLDSDKFAIRQRATRELENLHEIAEAEIQAALAADPSLESRQRLQALLDHIRSHSWPAERLRILRALETLETIGTADARKLLQALAKGAADDPLAQDARAALTRLNGKRDAAK